jgi:hypothetical protein
MGPTGDGKASTVTEEMIQAGIKALRLEIDWGDCITICLDYRQAVLAILTAAHEQGRVCQKGK